MSASMPGLRGPVIAAPVSAAGPVKPSVEARIRELRDEGMGILKIGRTLGIGTPVVQRVLQAA